MNIDFTLAGGVIFTGLVVVFIALIGLSLIVWLVGRLFIALSSPKKPKEDKPTASAKSTDSNSAASVIKSAAVLPQVEEGIGDEIVAVIAAALAAMGGGFALRSVRRAKEARSVWAQAGLTQNTQPF